MLLMLSLKFLETILFIEGYALTLFFKKFFFLLHLSFVLLTGNSKHAFRLGVSEHNSDAFKT